MLECLFSENCILKEVLQNNLLWKKFWSETNSCFSYLFKEKMYYLDPLDIYAYR